MNRRGAALFVAVVGAGLAALVVLTASQTGIRAHAAARDWSEALRADAAASNGLEQVLSRWPPSFRIACCGLFPPVIDTSAGVEVRIRLLAGADSTGVLRATARSGRAIRDRMLLVRLRPDSTQPGVIGEAKTLGSGRDWLRYQP